MAQLDEYDRNKVAVEVERKKEFGNMLNKTLNTQIKVTDEKRNRKINQIKQKAARKGPAPHVCNTRRCNLCTRVL